MDGFDDLLAPSRHVLEDNPFADPFAKRSGSPDPWASPFASSQPTEEYDSNTTPTADSSSTSDSYEPSSGFGNVLEDSIHTPSGSLDSATKGINDEGDEDELRDPASGAVQTPGFRESVAPAFSEIATVEPANSEEQVSHTITPPKSPSTPVPHSADTGHTTESLERSYAQQPSQSGSQISSPAVVVSPLERSTPIGIDHSIGLSLGGEVLGGWQGERAGWGTQVDDDSDDDKPIGQTIRVAEQSESKPSSGPQNPSRNENGIQPVFVISVDDPQKVGDPIRSFTMYTVHTRTTSPLFQKSAFSVLRRYSDFLWLYETLSNNNPGVVVPPVPEKNPFGRFDDSFVRQRRLALEKCIQKIANHPVLGKDSDLRMFLESDSFALDIKHRKAEIAHERGGLMASIGQTIAGPRFHETDEWFDRQKVYLDSLESQLRGLVKAIEVVTRQRSELAIATGEFAQTASDLSAADVGKQLSQSLSGLAEVERKAQEIQNAQSEQDVVTLMSTVDEYARLINSVRLAFNSRIRTYHIWRTAEADLLRTKQAHEKNRAQGRIPTDRLGFSLSQIADAERRALDSKHEFDHVSKLIKSEVARFEQERIEDFKDSLHAFLEGMISRQKELIGGWENYQQMLLKKVGTSGTMQNMPRNLT